MATREKVKMLKNRLREDKRLIKIKKAFGTLPEYKLDSVELRQEIESMMLTRKVRSLSGSKKMSTALIEAMLQDQSYRSRATEILMGCVRTDKNLSRVLDSLEDYMLVEYSDLLSSSFRTIKERKAFVEYVLRKYYEFLDKVDEVRQVAELLIVDVDKAGYMYKNMIEALNLVSKGRES